MLTPLVDPIVSLHGGVVVAYTLAGCLLGTISGLTPGVHANNFALLLAAVAPSLPGPPTAVAGAMLAAGVVHTFLDVVPALALGVPDAAMALGSLPGHRLVLAGRGREALRLSALGSGIALALAVPLAVPVTALVRGARPFLSAALPFVLLSVVVFLVLTERSPAAAVAGVLSFALASALGVATLDLSPPAPAPVGGVLAPLFAGLFGAPVLVDAVGGAGVPPQDDDGEVAVDAVALPTLAGTIAGALVGYLPGVSAAVASVLALTGLPGRTTARRFVVATSGANTATTVFGLFALVELGTPRTGVMVALSESPASLSLAPLVVIAVLAGAVAAVLVPLLGDRYLVVAAAVDTTRLSVAVLGVLVVASWLFAGLVGVGLFVLATLVGLVPVRLGCRRVHLMGVLLGPLVLSGLGLAVEM